MSERGRPRSADIDAAIIDAATELLIEHGFSKLTVEDVIVRAGTSRPAFYRRYSGIVALLPKVLEHRFGSAPNIDAGTLEGDLRALIEAAAAVFADPLVATRAAGFLSIASRDPEHGLGVRERFIAPWRDAFDLALERARARGEITGRIPSGYLFDIAIGPLLSRTLLPGAPPTDLEFVRQVLEAAITFTAPRLST
ncbi:MAG: TetR/AcrR family transcriptional regulator [Microbacterium sp.]